MALDGEGNVPVTQGFEGGLRDDVLHGTQHATRKSAEQERQRSLLGPTIGEGDGDHTPGAAR